MCWRLGALVARGVTVLLGGAISPLEGTMAERPQDWRGCSPACGVVAWRVRLPRTNPDLEAGAPSMYLQRQIHPLGIRITRAPARPESILVGG